MSKRKEVVEAGTGEIKERLPWKEYPDPTPVEVPVRFRGVPSLQDDIRRMVRAEISRAASEQGFESFEEADDFDVDDGEGEFITPYELSPLQEEAGFRDADAEVLDGRQKEGQEVNRGARAGGGSPGGGSGEAPSAGAGAAGPGAGAAAAGLQGDVGGAS